MLLGYSCSLKIMRQYLDLVETVLTKGRKRATSVQGVGNIVYSGYEMRFRPAEEFPLITTRSLKGSWKALVGELLWFLSGSTDIADLHKDGIHLWDPWATPEICAQYDLPEGSIGRSYGAQWRSWLCRDGSTIDQIAKLIKEIRETPDSKRMKVTAWNPEDVESVFIAPCHGDFKCIVAEGMIDLCMTQRSADLPVGVPFNIASYSLLLLMIAQVTGLKPGEFVHHLQDVHIYANQIELAREQLKRRTRDLPTIWINPEVKDLFSFTLKDFELNNYNPQDPMKYPVGV